MKIFNQNQTNFFMDKIADFYDKICSPCSEMRILFLSNIINSNKNIKSFLDVSCSTGETIYQLSKKGISIKLLGMDFSKGMIKTSRKKCKQKNNIKFFCGDMRICDQYNLKKIDLCYSNSLEWLPEVADVEKFIKSSYNILSNNGLLIIDIENKDQFNLTCQTNYHSSKTDKNNIYYKNTVYEKIDDFCNNILQTYVKIDLKKQELNCYSGFFVHRLIDLEQLVKLLKNNNFSKIKIYKNFNKELKNSPRYQIISKK